MKKILMLALMLGGCTTISAPTTVFELRAGYDAAFLVPAANYRQLYDSNPCPEGEHATLINVCGEREIVVKLQQADMTAEAALDVAESLSRQGGDISSSLSVAQSAVLAAEALLTVYNIGAVK